jgi:FkbM family methyltransferase
MYLIKKIIKLIFGGMLFYQKTTYRKESYSQRGEDLIVKSLFDTLGIEKPSYLDIGAHHPYYLSNTALLYQKGSRGINIEPDPYLFSEIKKARKKDINLNCGVGDRAGVMDFYEINCSTLNTFSKDLAESYSEEGVYKVLDKLPVLVKTLETIINDYSDGKFPDFFSIDAEGMDEAIIKSFNFESSCPTVIC